MILYKYNFINLVLIYIVLLNCNISAQPISPSEVITQTAKITLDALRGKEEYYKENSEELYSLIDSILLPNFDRNYAAYLVLGRYGRTATQEQRARFSIAVYNYIVKRNPELIDVWLNMGVVYALSNQKEKARSSWQRALNYQPDNKVALNYLKKLNRN